MPRVTLPPSTSGDKLSEICVASDGVDSLEFDVKDAGYLARSADKMFNPDIPTGFQAAGTVIGPLIPSVKTGDVYVGYFDTQTNTLYLIHVKIQPNCPKIGSSA
jgi:hypothetical protein